MKRNRSSLLILLHLLIVAVFAGCGDRTPAESQAKSVQGPRLVPLTNMVAIRAGSFMRMGRRVTLLRDYWLGKFEVTQAEYVALAGTNPSHFTSDPSLPVEKIKFLDAADYAARVTQKERAAGRLTEDYEYRLPTEAEWEYACRAGSTNHYSFGGDDALADAYAWTDENSQGATHPVGLKQPNAWGLYDMHGNVWEWCLDWYGDYPASELTDPLGPATGKYKVFRGGGWHHEAKFARASNRFMMEPATGIHFVGFRLALAPTAKPSSPDRRELQAAPKAK